MWQKRGTADVVIMRLLENVIGTGSGFHKTTITEKIQTNTQSKRSAGMHEVSLHDNLTVPVPVVTCRSRRCLAVHRGSEGADTIFG